MRWLLVVLAAACTHSAGESAAPPPLEPLPEEHVVDAAAMCKRMSALHEAHCGMFGEIELGATCEQEVSGSLADARSRAMTEQMDACTSQLSVCSDVTACIGAVEATTELRDCADHSEREAGNAVGQPYAAWRATMKRGLVKLSDVVSSKARPIELCGVATENYWLTTLACADGSHPLANKSAAEQARLGNVGAGGRCGSIIDHYQVRCPERAYDVYIDGFICPKP